MHVLLKHPTTGSTKLAATGWSWPLFLSAGGLMGIPLFFRGLALWGSAVFVIWSVRFALPLLVGDGAVDGIDWLLTAIAVGLSGYIGAKGNALIARHYMTCGYIFARPESVEARIAAESWGAWPAGPASEALSGRSELFLQKAID
jgi:hypothetical protein